MRIVNSSPDKFIIECIEIDLYDILYKAHAGSWGATKTHYEVDCLLIKYYKSNIIKSWTVGVKFDVTEIMVEVYIPRKVKIVCKI
jgi:hypothetical protein